MDQKRIDLSLLDPAHDELAWRRRIARIMAAAAPLLEGRARAYGPVRVLADWLRPALAAAAVLALLATAALTTVERRTGTTIMTAGVTEALQLPAQATQWLAEGRAPSVADLLSELEGEP